MLIATWNVNSIRTRINQVQEFLEEINPDLLCLQETKVQDSLFPRIHLETNGYKIASYGQKSYNGVAIISKEGFEDIRFGLDGELTNDNLAQNLSTQKRVISGLIIYKMTYWGEQTCDNIVKSTQKQCINQAYYIKDNKLLCGVHSKKDNRTVLPKNPNKS